jgi:hypothetical protein
MVHHSIHRLHVDFQAMAGSGEDVDLMASPDQGLRQAGDIGRSSATRDGVEGLPGKHADGQPEKQQNIGNKMVITYLYIPCIQMHDVRYIIVQIELGSQFSFLEMDINQKYWDFKCFSNWDINLKKEHPQQRNGDIDQQNVRM